jgi:hypothetical protein
MTVLEGSIHFLFAASPTRNKEKLRGLSPSANYTERPQLFGEVSGNFCGLCVLRGERDGSPRLYSRISRPQPLLFIPSSSSTVLN